jgi:hypothetical protein
MWQDKVIAICQMGAVIALIPIIFGKDKPGITPSVMNVVFPGIISFTLSTIHYWYAMITAGLISLGWLIISAQKILQRNNKKA